MNTKKSLKEKKRKLKKTQSMQFRILATIIFAMLAITVFIGGISIYEVDKYIQGESENFVKVTCDNEGAQINNIFEDIAEIDEVEEDLALPIKGGRITTTIADEEILIDGSILSQVTIFNESEKEIHITINFGEEIPLEVEESLSLGDIKIYSIIITESKSTIKYIGY